MSGDIFGCHNWGWGGGGNAPGILWAEARDTTQPPKVPMAVPTTVIQTQMPPVLRLGSPGLGRILFFKVCISDWQCWHPPDLGSHPDLPDQNLHFNKLPRGF